MLEIILGILAGVLILMVLGGVLVFLIVAIGSGMAYVARALMPRRRRHRRRDG